MEIAEFFNYAPSWYWIFFPLLVMNDEFMGEILDGEFRDGSLNKYGDGERSEIEKRRNEE